MAVWLDHPNHFPDPGSADASGLVALGGNLNPERLLSAYHTADGVKFWIITEWDRSITTILLPDDY